MQKGLVFDIQRYSIHDGPGIRTTVFLKGCYLRCFWCHNPEALSHKAELMQFSGKCINCKQCISVCPKRALKSFGNKIVLNRDLCDACGKCTDVCDTGALKITGRYLGTEEVFSEVMKDIEFYKTSGGGITVSGGEPLLQKDFVKELFKKCIDFGIHTAIETCMFTKYEDLSELLPYTRLILSDIKSMKDEVHRKATGVSNKIILENLKKVSQVKIPLIIRVPVIPGINDSEENIISTVNYVKDFPHLFYVELIAFHKMAKNKYKSLDMEYKAENLQLLPEGRLDQLKEAAGKYGVTIK